MEILQLVYQKKKKHNLALGSQINSKPITLSLPDKFRDTLS